MSESGENAVEIRVLIVQGSAEEAARLVHGLRRSGYAPRWRWSRECGSLPLEPTPDVVLAHHQLGAKTAAALAQVQREAPGVPVVVLADEEDEEEALDLVDKGADDYVFHDRMGRLGAAVRAALERRRLRERARRCIGGESFEALGRLCGGVAHDFNNLVTGIICSSEALLRAGVPQRGHVEAIGELGRRAAALTRQLLMVCRGQPFRRQRIDLNAVVTAAAPVLRPMMGDGVELVVDASADPAWVVADPIQVEQIVFNLALNARDAMSEGGRLGIHTTRCGDSVQLVVSDTGAGMDAATRERMFEPFFTTKEGRGTGLGLATVFEIVKRHGGEIRVDSEVGKGTTIAVGLPQDRSAD